MHPVPLPSWPFWPLLLEIQKYPVIPPPGPRLRLLLLHPPPVLSLASHPSSYNTGILFWARHCSLIVWLLYIYSLFILSRYCISLIPFPYLSCLLLFTLCFHDLSDDLDELTTSRLHHLYCLPTKVLPRRYRPARHRLSRLGPYPAAWSFHLSYYDACSLHTPVFISYVSRSSRFVSSQAAETVSSNKSAWHGADVWPVFDGIEGRH